MWHAIPLGAQIHHLVHNKHYYAYFVHIIALGIPVTKKATRESSLVAFKLFSNFRSYFSYTAPLEAEVTSLA